MERIGSCEQCRQLGEDVPAFFRHGPESVALCFGCAGVDPDDFGPPPVVSDDEAEPPQVHPGVDGPYSRVRLPGSFPTGATEEAWPDIWIFG